MAIKTYRFRLKAPGVDIEQLRSEVGDPAAVFSGDAGGVIVDVDSDDAFLVDLTEAMEARGYDFAEENPPTTPADDFTNQTFVAKRPGEVIHSYDGVDLRAELPLTTREAGWLVNDDGLLLVTG